MYLPQRIVFGSTSWFEDSVGRRGSSHQNPVASWKTAPVPATDTLQLAVCRQRKAGKRVPVMSQDKSIYARAVLDSGADISSIHELLSSFPDVKFPGVPIRSTLEESPRFVHLANGHCSGQTKVRNPRAEASHGLGAC